MDWWSVLLVVAGMVAFQAGVVYGRLHGYVPREDYDDALDEIRRLRSLLVAERDAKVKVYHPPYDWNAVRRRGGRR